MPWTYGISSIGSYVDPIDAVFYSRNNNVHYIYPKNMKDGLTVPTGYTQIEW